MSGTEIIVVSGLPGAGKSTVAAWLSRRLLLPLLAKDNVKESLFDTLQVGDATWSKQLSAASYAVLFAMADELVRARASCILEGNFRWQQTREAFARLAEHATFRQVWCHASTDLLIARLRKRAADPARHPGHRDAEFVPALIQEAADPSVGPLPLPGALLTLDTGLATADVEAALKAFIDMR